MADYDIFALGNVVLQAGLTLRNAQLAYKTYGRLNSHRDNAIVYPTFYGAQHPQNEPMIGPGRAPDPTKYFIVVPNMFGIERLQLVTGFSMGAQQTFHWGALFPDMVERILPWCGSTKTSRHNFVFLEGVKAAITADDAWQGGWYEKQPTKGLRAGIDTGTDRSLFLISLRRCHPSFFRPSQTVPSARLLGP